MLMEFVDKETKSRLCGGYHAFRGVPSYGGVTSFGSHNPAKETAINDGISHPATTSSLQLLMITGYKGINELIGKARAD